MLIKVEVLIPLYYNPGSADARKMIEGDKFTQTFDEIAQKFPNYTVDNSPLLGNWFNPATKNKVSDENMSCWVICERNSENTRFFKKLKHTLKARFQQDDILIYHIAVFIY